MPGIVHNQNTSTRITNYHADAATTRVRYCTHVIVANYCTDHTCATVHVYNAMTDRHARALRTRGHARSRVHCDDRRINNLRARPVFILHMSCSPIGVMSMRCRLMCSFSQPWPVLSNSSMKRTTYLALDDGNRRAAHSTISLSIADEQNKRARSSITSLTKHRQVARVPLQC